MYPKNKNVRLKGFITGNTHTPAMSVRDLTVVGISL